MDGKRLYCAGGTAAARYAGEYLGNFYIDLAERPGSDVGAVLLDVPSFAPDGTLRMGGSVENLLAQEQRYASMLAFLRQAFVPVLR